MIMDCNRTGGKILCRNKPCKAKENVLKFVSVRHFKEAGRLCVRQLKDMRKEKD